MPIWDLEPTRINKSLKGKYILLYSLPKTGKTTFLSKMKRTLIIATEPGTNALNNLFVQNITKWSEFKRILRELKDKRSIEKYDNVGIDTVDILWDICVKFICDKEDVSDISEIPYGRGYVLAKTEFSAALREIAFLGYGIVMISHSSEKTFKDENGADYTQICPALPRKPHDIVNEMVDIIGYIANAKDGDKTDRFLFLRGNKNFFAGSRFKYIEPRIPFSYEALVESINTAIDRQNEEDGIATSGVTTETAPQVAESMTYDQLIAALYDKWNEIKAVNAEDVKKISNIVERVFGKRMKLSEATPNQVDLLQMVYDEVSLL